MNLVIIVLPLLTSGLLMAEPLKTDKSPAVSFTFLILFGVLIYFVPSAIAIMRKHNNLVGILALNFLLGWTLLGWVGALVWSLMNSNSTPMVVQNYVTPSSNKYEELEKLNQLKSSGAISEEEYELEKSKLLKNER